MARAKWTIRNYNTFLREERARYGLNLSQARQAYRELRSKLERPVYGADVSKHPRLSLRAAAGAVAVSRPIAIAAPSVGRVIAEHYPDVYSEYEELEEEWIDFDWAAESYVEEE